MNKAQEDSIHSIYSKTEGPTEVSPINAVSAIGSGRFRYILTRIITVGMKTGSYGIVSANIYVKTPNATIAEPVGGTTLWVKLISEKGTEGAMFDQQLYEAGSLRMKTIDLKAKSEPSEVQKAFEQFHFEGIDTLSELEEAALKYNNNIPGFPGSHFIDSRYAYLSLGIAHSAKPNRDSLADQDQVFKTPALKKASREKSKKSKKERNRDVIPVSPMHSPERKRERSPTPPTSKKTLEERYSADKTEVLKMMGDAMASMLPKQHQETPPGFGLQTPSTPIGMDIDEESSVVVVEDTAPIPQPAVAVLPIEQPKPASNKRKQPSAKNTKPTPEPKKQRSKARRLAEAYTDMVKDMISKNAINLLLDQVDQDLVSLADEAISTGFSAVEILLLFSGSVLSTKLQNIRKLVLLLFSDHLASKSDSEEPPMIYNLAVAELFKRKKDHTCNTPMQLRDISPEILISMIRDADYTHTWSGSDGETDFKFASSESTMESRSVAADRLAAYICYKMFDPKPEIQPLVLSDDELLSEFIERMNKQ